MNYVKERQLKIVIFENVYGAPWQTTTDCVFPLTDYAAVSSHRPGLPSFF